MSSAFDATDTRTRRFRNVGNSCYINSILQALFAVPPVQRLYESEDLNCDFSEGMRRDDGRNDGDIACARVYREARAAARRGEPMKPQVFLDLFYKGNQDDASTFLQLFLDSSHCFAPRLMELFQGRDRPLSKCGACGQTRDLTGVEDLTTLSVSVQTQGRPMRSMQEAIDHFFTWEEVDFDIDCHPDCRGRNRRNHIRHRLEAHPQVLCMLPKRWVGDENHVSNHKVHLTRRLQIDDNAYDPVSYTHLTLPTILLV